MKRIEGSLAMVGKLFGAVVLLVVMCIGVQARSEQFPSRTIKIIIPFAAGGPTDVIGRPLAEQLQRILGTAVVIENRPGANGIVGSEAVANSEPDGYTLLLTTGSHIGNAVFNASKLRYDVSKDFKPVAGFYNEDGEGLLLVASKSLAARTLAEMLEAGRKKSGGLVFAHSGVGNITQLGGELLALYSGVKMLGVPFRGTGAALTEIIAGRIDFHMAGGSALLPAVKDGQVEALASTGKRRLAVLPNVPTMVESGYPEYVLFGFRGLFAPGKTPEAVIRQLYDAANRALNDPAMINILTKAGESLKAIDPETFATFLENDLNRQKKIAELLKLRSN
jgi:tripartite-type tricarboxylate transporter receptor subunit TctC